LNSLTAFILSWLFSSLTSQDNPSDKDINQGTLVVFNLDPSVSNEDLRQIFGAYGEVKEVIVLSYFNVSPIFTLQNPFFLFLTGYDQNTSPFQHRPYDNSLLLLSTSPKESKSGVSCRMSDFGHTQEKDKKILHQSLGQTHIYIFALLCKL
jgi:hypothetical protein